MITKERIEKNKELYIQKAKQYEFFDERLFEYLGEDLFTAPATERTDKYNAFPGGLVDHILRVSKYASKFNNQLPEPMQVDTGSLIKVCFLSMIGRTFMFQIHDSQWHIDKGMPYKYVDNLVSMRTGERSIYYIHTLSSVTLSDEEFQAISNFDKGDDDIQAAFHTEVLGELLKAANLFAIKEEKYITKNG